MGCGYSDAKSAAVASQQLDSFLTPEQIRLVKHSWILVGDDLTETGLLVFKKLFEYNSGLKNLFVRLMKTSKDGSMDFEDEKLRRHATIVMEGLGAAVESLEDSIFLTNVLIAMGERHATYNVKPEMVPQLWPAIRDTLREKLGADFLPEVERAWSHVFEYIGEKFNAGIRKVIQTRQVDDERSDANLRLISHRLPGPKKFAATQ